MARAARRIDRLRQELRALKRGRLQETVAPAAEVLDLSGSFWDTDRSVGSKSVGTVHAAIPIALWGCFGNQELVGDRSPGLE
jgi:hypothetical protein